jgi:hypothetical protein
MQTFVSALIQCRKGKLFYASYKTSNGTSGGNKREEPTGSEPVFRRVVLTPVKGFYAVR